MDGIAPEDLENTPFLFFMPRCTRFLSENGISQLLARPEKSHLTLCLPIFEDNVTRSFTSAWLTEVATSMLRVNIPRYGTFRTLHIHCIRDKDLPLATDAILLPPDLGSVVKMTSWVVSLSDKRVGLKSTIETTIRHRTLSRLFEDAVRRFDPTQTLDSQIFKRWWRLLLKLPAWRIGWWILRNIKIEDSMQKDVSNDKN